MLVTGTRKVDGESNLLYHIVPSPSNVCPCRARAVTMTHLCNDTRLWQQRADSDGGLAAGSQHAPARHQLPEVEDSKWCGDRYDPSVRLRTTLVCEAAASGVRPGPAWPVWAVQKNDGVEKLVD
jgi:hypothetical protein